MIPVTYMHPPARHSSRVGQRFQVALGAAAAFSFSRKLRKRIQVARKPLVSKLP
jgi:hypothetical protein